MTRSVKDAAYLLQAIAGKDPNDNYTSAIPFDPLPDYVAACNYSSLRGKRIGIPRNVIYSQLGDEPVLAAFEAAIQTIKCAGATIIDNTNITAYALDQYLNGNASLIVLEADFVSDLPDEYLSKLTYNPQNVHNLPDVSNFTHTFPPEDYPDRDTAVWDEALALGFNNTDPRFWAEYQINLQTGGVQGILGLLTNYSLDALILPTAFSPGLPALVGLAMLHLSSTLSQELKNLAGAPPSLYQWVSILPTQPSNETNAAPLSKWAPTSRKSLFISSTSTQAFWIVQQS